jgi:hypothetical protein
MPVPKSVTTQLSPLRIAVIFTDSRVWPFNEPWSMAEAAVQSLFMLKLEKPMDMPDTEFALAYESIAL